MIEDAVNDGGAHNLTYAGSEKKLREAAISRIYAAKRV